MNVPVIKNYMKYFILSLSLILSFAGFSQFDIGVQKADSCYFRYDKNGKRLRTPQEMRYAEWECGKLAGVIDCHGNLSFDEETNTVVRISQDNTNLMGVGKPFTGTCESCHMNGILERRVTFIDGKEHGIDTTFYTSGCPQVIRSFEKGLENGPWYYYYDSTAMPAWEMNYLLGEKHGKQIYFTSDGDTLRLEHYRNGLLDGVKKLYYPDSSLIKNVINYKAGRFDGKFILYNKKGIIIEDLNYKNGQKHKECKYYYDDGTLLKTENWNEGLKNGEWKIYYYEQNLQVVESWNNGKKNGWFEEYHPNGVAKRRRLYNKKEELEEEHRYDEHGRETYSFGAPTGNQDEDDEAPTVNDRKKKKKKKDK